MRLCPLCNVNHKNLCPRLPKALCPFCQVYHVGRCPRLPSAAAADMKMKLSGPSQMAPSLESFVHDIFNDQVVMDGGDYLSNRVYEIYAGGSASDQGAPGNRGSKFFFQSIALRLPLWINHGFLQNKAVPFKEVIKRCASSPPLPAAWLTDFLYFPLFKGGAACRLYMNVPLNYIALVADGIRTYVMKTPNHGLLDFKIAGPAAVDARVDVFVVYLKSNAAAQAMGQFFLTPEYKPLFRAGVPGMTSRLANGIGISTGAEPEQQQTGMGSTDGQSFGTIRSELIAMAILNFNVNKVYIGSNFEIFKRFVCEAFKAYGLDPMNPGRNKT